MTYKTPGVYVVEKSIFPPSVAQVETAIPAFIGYTEKADNREKDDLHLKAKRVSSLLEFRQYFGGAPPLNIDKVTLDGNNSLTEAKVQPWYYMYDSLQLFFMNGGGDCYIISVGKYGSTVSFEVEDADPKLKHGLNYGLNVLEKVDEPTIILFPDAVLLSSADKMYTLQKNALDQCNKLMDRVAVFDLREKDSTGADDWEGQKDDFRNKIGTSFLKYGAAYTPHLRTSLDKNIKYRDFRNIGDPPRFTRSGSAIKLENLTNDTEIRTLITRFDAAINDLELLEEETGGIDRVAGTDIRGRFTALYQAAVTDNSDHNQYQAALDFLYQIIVVADGWFFDTTVGTGHTSDHSTDGRSPDNYQSFQTQAEESVFADFNTAVMNVLAFDRASADAATSTGAGLQYTTFSSGLVAATITQYGEDTLDNPWDAAATGPVLSDANEIFDGSNQAERRLSSLPHLKNLFEQLFVSIQALFDLAAERMNSLENSLLEQFPVYKNLVGSLNEALSTIPPSGAIAGIYAQVDRNRGVWKAPANVSLNGVSDLTYHFTQSETDRLNVDTNFGKSINAIKYMTGMGFMVWGARTLAGNDNEWRYISVRRFFNMVEESVKKSTMWAVFEPNDANTWVKVKGMIDNFLTLQWRNGALQGAKPDEAFFVKVGLGQTMTSIDILEGRMNVEIGMAVVRPAEFIILTFSHKMATSS